MNGAGKTSTFKMLTGDEIISAGDAWINGISIKKRMDKIHKKIGYCPQFDALLEDLTGRETLRIFCLLRGVPRSQINHISINLATELNFIKHIDKQVKAYSGGNKRKLSTALTLIGDPNVMYLDEPTSKQSYLLRDGVKMTIYYFFQVVWILVLDVIFGIW